MPRAPLERLALLAGAVFLSDFASKRWALDHLGDAAPTAVGLHFGVINNTRLAWGLESGGFELEVTAIATLAIALLVVRICHQLTEVDASAPAMLGLLLGAGAANLADALIPPHGVVDFIALTGANGTTTTFNVADVAAAVGLGLCARTAWRIAQLMRGRRARPSRRRAVPLSPGVAHARQRLIISSGHALLAMCAFLWLYSMAIAWRADAGTAAPSALFLGVGVFAAAFVASQVSLWSAARRVADESARPTATASIERVVLDGSLATGVGELTDGVGVPRDRPSRRDRPLPYEPRQAPDRTSDGDRA